MELYFNELSLHGQFQEIRLFQGAIYRVMQLRGLAQRFGRELYCHRSVLSAQVTPTASLAVAVQALRIDERRSLMQWLTRQGPFWEDSRLHGADDYLEYAGQVVTDSAVGEAAFCCLEGLDRSLVSLVPSSWQFSPIPVAWVRDDTARATVQIPNHWDQDGLEIALRRAPIPLGSWRHLETTAQARCPGLTFLAGAFEALQGHPFAPGAAQRLLVLLDTLHTFRSCVDEHGKRTPEGHRLYQDHFTGDKAWFSDSSDSDQHDFRSDFTFRHPTEPGRLLFCPWHGKVKTPQLRIHFTWPVGPDEDLYIVYVGPKITIRS